MPTITQPITTWYKSSPLWLIPQDWEMISLWEIWDTYSWLSWKSKEDFWEGSPYIPYMNIFSNPVIKDGNFDFVKINEWENQHKVENWDIFFTTSSETPEEVWMCSTYWWNNNNLYLNSFCFWIHLKEKNKYSPIFLSNFFRSNFWRKIMYKLAQWATRYNLSKQWLLKQKLWIPKVEEQTAIATILSNVDKTIQQTQEMIKKLELRNKWLGQNLLTGKIRVKGFNDKWNNIQFKEIYLQFKEKSTDEKYEILSVTKDKIVSQSEYFNKEIASEDKSWYLIVKKWDFVMSWLNFWMGAAHVVENFEIWIVSPAYKTFRIHNKNISKEFMRFFVESNIMRRALVWSSVQWASIVRRNLDQEMLESWIFKIPNIQEQETIANILNSAEKELNIYKQKLTKLQIIKKGLMQQLLTGKVRVKEFRK